MQEYSTIAAVDLGSNSFRLQVARVVQDQLYPLDSLREAVRMAEGLTPEKLLDSASQARGLECLKRFGERLRGLPADAVRAVGTNTLRVAKNAPAFLQRAEEALGFPIDVIAGREEARLIHLGVVHSLPPSPLRRLVIDIGGGSTECIIGTGLVPRKMESLYMGCVSYSRRFFPDGRITRDNLRRAEIAARMEVQAIKADFSADRWQEAIGSSGTARALADILQGGADADAGITADGLARLRMALEKAGDVKRLTLPGLRSDRLPVLPGGFAIMAAIFAELGVERMIVASGALREGVLYDLLGRFHHHDMRETTVSEFMRRYHVDPAQARRVGALALTFLEQLGGAGRDGVRQQLGWAACLHEIGISIAHSGYHKHSAYIIEHADMPGFSKKEQMRLAALVRTQRGKLGKIEVALSENLDWDAVIALRLAVLFNRSRTHLSLPPPVLARAARDLRLEVDGTWMNNNPLTEAALDAEAKEWKEVGLSFAFGPPPRGA
ncbi:MAG: exopolyphosphatase [Betaproteobacteria bacterium]|nr:exopolyphosphatase [Betaproteobacteria bacterium]